MKRYTIPALLLLYSCHPGNPQPNTSKDSTTTVAAGRAFTLEDMGQTVYCNPSFLKPLMTHSLHHTYNATLGYMRGKPNLSKPN